MTTRNSTCRRRGAAGAAHIVPALALAAVLIGTSAPARAEPAIGAPVTTVSQAPDDAATRKAIDDRLAAFKARITALSADTQAGVFWKDAKVPVKLDAVREAMLAYGNAERHTPGFRRAVGAKTATNIDARPATITNLDGTSEPVADQPDMKLEDRLNGAAQWLAEALATKRASDHRATTAAVDGRPMATLMDRITYFGVGNWGVAEIVASGWDAGASPYNWMAGDTHYRWYFGVDGSYPLIGYGAAMDAQGKWHYVGVAQRIPVPTAGSATPPPPPTPPVAAMAPAADRSLLAVQNGGRGALPPLAWHDDVAADAVAQLGWAMDGATGAQPAYKAAGAGAWLRATGMDAAAMMQRFVIDRNPNIVTAGRTETGCATAVTVKGERWLLCRWK